MEFSALGSPMPSISESLVLALALGSNEAQHRMQQTFEPDLGDRHCMPPLRAWRRVAFLRWISRISRPLSAFPLRTSASPHE